MADTKEDKDKYSHHEFTTWCDGEHKFTWQYAIHTDCHYHDDINATNITTQEKKLLMPRVDI